MCLYQISICDKAGQRIVPCGVCYECLQRRRSDWTFRLEQELISSSSSYFVTLTYSDENVTEKLEKNDFQKYMKRLRHDQKALKYFAVGEYGMKTYRPHWHMIIFNISDVNDLDKHWNKGFIQVAKTNKATIHYVTGYLLKQGEYDLVGMVFQKKDEEAVKYKPVMMCSKGLGKVYVENGGEYHITNQTFKTHNGVHLSRYLKMKIFEKHEELRLGVTEDLKAEFLQQFDPNKKVSAKKYYALLHQFMKNKQKF